MKFWTVQTKDVIEIIQEKGVYQPDLIIVAIYI